MKIFSERLRFERKSLKLSQKEMATKIGMPYGMYKNYELLGTANGREPSLETLVKISDCLGVSVDYLLGRED